MSRWTILTLATIVITSLATVTTAYCSSISSFDIHTMFGVTSLLSLMGCLSVLIPLVVNEWHLVPLILVNLMTLQSLVVSVQTQQEINVKLIYHSIAVSIAVAIAAMIPSLLQFSFTKVVGLLIHAAGMILTLSYTVAACVQEGSPVLSTWISIFTLGLLALWYRNRTRLLGNLIFCELHKTAMNTAGAIGFLMVIMLHHDDNNNDSFFLVLPLFMGAVLAVLCIATFCSVADVWQSVGSGQFWMVSLDTGSMFFYLVLPIIILAIRANDKYGTVVRQLLGDAMGGIDLASPIFSTTCSVLLIGASITVGVPLIAVMCPFGAHFFGKVYTSGQASTRKVALCLDWSEDVTEITIKDTKPQVINFLISRDHLQNDSQRIQAVAKLGHAFCISVENVKDLVQSHRLYETILSYAPEWMCPGTLPWSPALVHAAATLNMKVGLWSHGLHISSNTCLTVTQIKDLQKELESTMGGTIIYLSGENVLPVARQIVKDFDRFAFCSLSQVAKNDLKMELS